VQALWTRLSENTADLCTCRTVCSDRDCCSDYGWSEFKIIR
jgi:hypothetical protein